MPRSRTAQYKWWVVVMLWFICFFNYADRQAISAVFPLLSKEFGFSKVELGLIGSAFMWLYAGVAPVAGFIGDSFRRKYLILGGCLFWSAVTMGTGLAQKLWHFVGIRAAEGFGESFYFPASMSLIADYHDSKTRSRAMAVHQSSVYAGTVLGAWFGAWLAERHGWRVSFYVFGFAGMVLAAVLFRFLHEPVRGEQEHLEPGNTEPLRVKETLQHVFRTPTAIVLMIVFAGANFVAVTFLTWTPTFLVEKFNFKLAAAGFTGTAFIHFASAFGAPLGGILADKLGGKFPGGRMMVQAAALLIGASFVAVVGLTHNVTVLLSAMILFGFCKGVYDSNIFASLYDVVEPKARATAAGVMNTVGWSGGALAPILVGWFAERGPQEDRIANFSKAVAFGGVIYLVCAFLLLFAVVRFARRNSDLKT